MVICELINKNLEYMNQIILIFGNIISNSIFDKIKNNDLELSVKYIFIKFLDFKFSIKNK